MCCTIGKWAELREFPSRCRSIHRTKCSRLYVYLSYTLCCRKHRGECILLGESGYGKFVGNWIFFRHCWAHKWTSFFRFKENVQSNLLGNVYYGAFMKNRRRRAAVWNGGSPLRRVNRWNKMFREEEKDFRKAATAADIMALASGYGENAFAHLLWITSGSIFLILKPVITAPEILHENMEWVWALLFEGFTFCPLKWCGYPFFNWGFTRANNLKGFDKEWI